MMPTALLSSSLPQNPTISLLAILALGFFLGMRHATDPDHVIAVSTIVSRERTLKHAAIIGALWGAGHTLTILAVGTGIIAFSLVISPALGLTMEFSVGLMLILLGLLNLAGFRNAVKNAIPAAARRDISEHSHFHSHGDYIHNHSHQHSPDTHSHDSNKTPLALLDRMFGKLSLYQIFRPLIVGVVHGLAGSAAIALLVLTTIRNSGWAVAYLLIFGVGTIAGMMLITVALGSAISYTQSRSAWLSGRLSAVTGVISLAFGLFVAYQIGIVNGLLTHHPHWTPH
jgi:high-affinity nickel-transport protein